ncbi:MAG: PorV/PorQ family protein [Melioribacteraceae bacterium]
MKRVLATSFVLLFLFSDCFGQISSGARQIAIARSDMSSSNDVFTLFNNPAGLSLIKVREVGLFYSPAPFGVTELSNAAAVYCEPTSLGSFSAGFSIYGFDLYKETNITLGFGRKISKNFSVGLTSTFHNVSIKNYGSKGVLIFNIGSIARLNELIGFGFLIENITRSTIGNESNQIPTVIWLGTDLHFTNVFSFNAAIQKEIGFNPSLRLGTEYSVMDFLILRIGVSNQPDTYSGGFGIVYNFIQADYAVSSHPDLGLTHQFGLILRFTKD